MMQSVVVAAARVWGDVRGAHGTGILGLCFPGGGGKGKKVRGVDNTNNIEWPQGEKKGDTYEYSDGAYC